jgi:hypothetical protein
LTTSTRPRRAADALGYDQRYAYQSLPSVGVDPGVTSVSILTQTARTLAAPANVIRAIDAVTAKPETTETLTVSVTPLKQLASVVSDIPNVFIENAQVGSIIENDLKLALTDALDDLLRQAVAASGFQAPGTDPLLISIRKAMSTVMLSGYAPNTLILRPADAETLDTLRTSGSELMYVFAAGNFAPSEIFGLKRYISKNRGGADRDGRGGLRQALLLAGQPCHLRAGRRTDEQEPRPDRGQRPDRCRAPGRSGQDRCFVMAAEKKSPAKSSFTVRTDCVIVAGTPSFYGDKVKLSDEEAKPLLKEGKVSKG